MQYRAYLLEVFTCLGGNSRMNKPGYGDTAARNEVWDRIY